MKRTGLEAGKVVPTRRVRAAVMTIEADEPLVKIGPWLWGYRAAAIADPLCSVDTAATALMSLLVRTRQRATHDTMSS